ncbi:rifin [Plasmodium falciparum IGH-CR14]|uniref:Rifin n=1 Tax=Plasmodium falciparum IGH-CR14 TaxID=580059 RepID=A0A0L1I5X3_PLAFA|nr:rifin [Plasmodium falciparum IGH-CR14]
MVALNSKNKPHTTPHHTPTTTSRVLSECDLYIPNYDKDPDMKYVKKNFDRQTSKRFEEYDERMTKNRKKCKEQRDKDIQDIIGKDKIQKSLAERVEKGCLRCACGLGGGVAPVWGLVSGLWYVKWSQYVPVAVTKAGITEGIKEGLSQIMKLTTQWHPGAKTPPVDVTHILSSGKFTNTVTLYDIVHHINDSLYSTLDTQGYTQYCGAISSMASNNLSKFNRTYSTQLQLVSKAVTDAEIAESTKLAADTIILTNTIIASVVAIVVIALVMLIIYLILRYRRKKKNDEKTAI